MGGYQKWYKIVANYFPQDLCNRYRYCTRALGKLENVEV